MTFRHAATAAALMICTALSPAARAYDVAYWQGCDFAVVHDTSQLVSPDAQVYRGSMSVGVPPAMFNSPSDQPGPADVTCSIQRDTPNFGQNVMITRPVTVAEPFDINVPPGATLYLCSVLHWDSAKRAGQTAVLDADLDPSNGVQCALAVTVPADDSRDDCTPPDPRLGLLCAAQGYYRICTLDDCGGRLPNGQDVPPLAARPEDHG